MTDCLFIIPGAAKQIYQGLSTDYSAREPNTWSMLLANHLRTKKLEPLILDGNAEGLTYQQQVDKTKEINPRLICLCAVSQNPNDSTIVMTGISAYCKLLKECYPEYKTIIIGTHPSALPTDTLMLEGVDFIAQNEGVYTLSNLLQTDFSYNQLLKVKGLGFKEQNKIILNQLETFVPENKLDIDLPGHAIDLINTKLYRTSSWHADFDTKSRTPFFSMYTSFGCPFACHFCNIQTPFGKEAGMRCYKPEFIIKEFEKIVKLGIINIKIADEMFMLRPKHFYETCKLLAERDLDLNIWCYARIDSCKEKYLELMRKAGIRWIGLGLESSSRTIRADVTKGTFRDIDISEVIKSCKDHDIKTTGNFIFGLWLDNLETMQANLDLSKELLCENVNYNICQALPGSALYIQAKKEGWKLPDRFEGYAQHSYWSQPLATKYISAAEVVKFRDKAFKEYFNYQPYQEMINNKLGPVAVNSINNMLKIELKRSILNETLF